MYFLRFALAGILSLLTLQAVADDRPILHRVMIFDSENSYEGVQSYLIPTANGRYKTEKHEPLLTAGSCGDLLSQFQARPLGVMEDNQYITPALKKILLDLKAQNIKAPQIILLIQESAVTEAEARQLIPNEFELEKRTTLSPTTGRKRHLLRGALWAVRGFAFDLNDPRLRFHPLPVPSESAKLAQGLARGLNREQVPFVYEIGRLLSEEKPFGGNFKLLSSIMTNVVANEADALGLDPQKVVITAHALDGPQGRLFAAHFPYRVMDALAVGRIEADPKAALASYLETPAPTSEEWTSLKDVVLYASLEQFINRFPAAKASEFAVLTEAATGGLIPAERGQFFWRDFKTLFRQDYVFDNPQMGRSPKPLIVARAGDGMFIQNLMALTKAYGLPEVNMRDKVAAAPVQNILNLWNGMHINYLPDAMLELWEGSHVILHPAFKGDLPGIPTRNISHFVTNLDPQMVRKFPRIYLAMVILSLRDSIDFEMTQLAPGRFTVLRDKVNEDRARLRLPLVSTVDADIFFETYGLGFGATDPLIMQELSLLGGVKFTGAIMSFTGFKSGPRALEGDINIELGARPGDLFEFKTAQLRKLAADYSYLGNNARNNLSTGNYKSRLKMLFAPTF